MIHNVEGPPFQYSIKKIPVACCYGVVYIYPPRLNITVQALTLRLCLWNLSYVFATSHHNYNG